MNEPIIKCAYTRLVPLEELIPNPKNPNRHPDGQIKRLAEIISYQGQRLPIVVSNQSGLIVKGHGRLQVLKELGWSHAAVDFQDYDNEDQEYADMIADNAVSMWSELDLSMINSEIPNLELPSIDLLGIKDFVVDMAEKIPPKGDEIICPNCNHKFQK